jgi:hypothetical protein
MTKNYLKRLEDLFSEYNNKLQLFDKDCIRDKKFDFDVISGEKLESYLKNELSLKEKKRLLLSQVGYLRINLFYEYYARIQVVEKDTEFAEALKLMDEYIKTIAMPFLVPRMQQSWLYRHIGNLPETTVNVDRWQRGYKKWFEMDSRSVDGEKEETKEFSALKEIFVTLYSLSFTYDNFPPVLGAEEREYL